MIAEQKSGAYRVVNGERELIAKDTEIQSELLSKDGFKIDDSKSKLKVSDFQSHFTSHETE